MGWKLATCKTSGRATETEQKALKAQGMSKLQINGGHPRAHQEAVALSDV